MSQRNTLIHIGIKGTVLALDRATGAIVWENRLKGGDFVNLVLDENDLFATTKGEVFCLDPTTGQVRWNNPLRGFGWGLVTIAAGGTSIAAMARHRQQQEQAAASAAATAG